MGDSLVSINSSPFSPTVLTEDDANKFIEQYLSSSSKGLNTLGQEALERGRLVRKSMEENNAESDAISST